MVNTRISAETSKTPVGPTDAKLVNAFFKYLEAVYGAAACNAQWPTAEHLKTAKRVYAPLICKYDWPTLQGVRLDPLALSGSESPGPSYHGLFRIAPAIQKPIPWALESYGG